MSRSLIDSGPTEENTPRRERPNQKLPLCGKKARTDFYVDVTEEITMNPDVSCDQPQIVSVVEERELARRETGLSPHYWEPCEQNRLKPCRGKPFYLRKDLKFGSQSKFPMSIRG
jgi:hypothetical protein